MSADKHTPRTFGGWVTGVLATIVILVLLPPVLLFLAIRTAFYSLVLVGIWTTWLPQGKDTLVVYSNSPHWQKYFEAALIPLINSRCYVLNYSERTKWRHWFSLRNLTFDGFSGEKEFNPLVIVFKPFRWPKRFRFYKAFHDLKHGNEKPVRSVIDQLAKCLDSSIPYPENPPRESA